MHNIERSPVYWIIMEDIEIGLAEGSFFVSGNKIRALQNIWAFVQQFEKRMCEYAI